MRKISETGLPWLDKALGFLGTKEIPGPKHNPLIVDWAQKVSKGQIEDDETAWCGTFVGAMMIESGLQSKLPSNPLGARSYLELKTPLSAPAQGCIAIWWRTHPTNSWHGHVNFVVGKNAKGELMCIGGNQNNEVNIAPYAISGSQSRLLGYRWPNISPAATRFNLPIIDSTARITSEA